MAAALVVKVISTISLQYKLPSLTEFQMKQIVQALETMFSANFLFIQIFVHCNMKFKFILN